MLQAHQLLRRHKNPVLTTTRTLMRLPRKMFHGISSVSSLAKRSV
jgi:hypothetical protein